MFYSDFDQTKIIPNYVFLKIIISSLNRFHINVTDKNGRSPWKFIFFCLVKILETLMAKEYLQVKYLQLHHYGCK